MRNRFRCGTLLACTVLGVALCSFTDLAQASTAGSCTDPSGSSDQIFDSSGVAGGDVCGGKGVNGGTVAPGAVGENGDPADSNTVTISGGTPADVYGGQGGAGGSGGGNSSGPSGAGDDGSAAGSPAPDA